MSSTGEELRRQYMLRRSMYSGLGDSEPLHPRWDGGVDSRGVRHRPIWGDLGQYADTHGLDPSDWVASLFDEAVAMGKMPWPGDLRRAAVLQRVANSGKNRLRDKIQELRSDRLDFLREVMLRSVATNQPVDVVRVAAALDSSVRISSFVRYAEAFAIGNLAMASLFYAEAKKQYQAFPAAYEAAFSQDERISLAVASLREVPK